MWICRHGKPEASEVTQRRCVGFSYNQEPGGVQSGHLVRSGLCLCSPQGCKMAPITPAISPTVQAVGRLRGREHSRCACFFSLNVQSSCHGHASCKAGWEHGSCNRVGRGVGGRKYLF